MSPATAPTSAEAVTAFRLNSHHLSHRLPIADLLTAAGQCAVQNSPPGSALQALHARVAGVTQGLFDAHVADTRSMLQTWSIRGAPFFVPTRDAAVFTAGVLPPSEAAIRHLLPGMVAPIAQLGLSVARAVELCGDEIGPVLTGRRLAINELGRELAAGVTRRLTADQRRRWSGPGPWAVDQSLGEGIVHFCLRILALQGVVCFAARAGHQAPLVLVTEWLDQPIPSLAPQQARAELLRRFLHCYGPATPGQFATWLGIRAGDAHHWWTLIRDELTAVDHRGRSWLRTADLAALGAAPPPVGARLLPPHDPYTQAPDRDTLLDRQLHRALWRSTGAPGALLVDGSIVGTWRSRKTGNRLSVEIAEFRALTADDRAALNHEIAQLAALRNARSTDVVVEQR